MKGFVTFVSNHKLFRMKKKLLLKLLLIVAFSLNAQTNLVSNGDVEIWDNGLLTDWISENNVTQNSATVFSGTSSASLNLEVRFTNPKIISLVPLESGITYNVSYYYKYVNDNYGGTHPISLKLIRNGSATTTTKNTFASNNDWTQVTTTFTPDTTGDYELSISTTTFDEEVFEILVDNIEVYDPNDTTASISDEVFNANFSIFPNPTSDFINVETNTLNSIEKLTIINTNGKEIITSIETKINVSNLSTGVYFLKIKTDNNKIAIKKFIRE